MCFPAAGDDECARGRRREQRHRGRQRQPYDATVVSYDPSVDIAILAVPNLPAGPLAFADAAAKTGTDALVLGYPGGGDFVATPARIREIIELSGPDIYRNATVTREVYTIRATVEQGNSGGPLIDLNGNVLGVVFGAAVDDPTPVLC
ncbi:trypsin family protein [Mycobacterium xenopi 3993]|nr:trypsin family protein [Mycobacterium xenopi 3993]